MKYTINPIVVDAIQWDGSQEALNQITILSEPNPRTIKYSSNLKSLIIITDNGPQIVNYGDWIVSGVQGVLFVIKDYMFKILCTQAK